MEKHHDFHPSASAQLTVVNVWHVIAGLYIWEYFTGLNYEWGVIRGHLPYRWSIWIYSLTRLAALVSVIINIITMDIMTPINCQFWVIFSAILLLLSSSIASLLIFLRTIAIWNRNKVVALAIVVWGIITAFHLHNIALIRSVWLVRRLRCSPAESSSSAYSYILTIIADMALLLIILIGLLVLRRRSGGASGLTGVLWKQGIMWLIIALVAEIPLVFTVLQLDDRLHDLLVTPSHVILTIAATRMHRSLVDFTAGSSDSDVAQESPGASNLAFSDSKPAPSTAPEWVEIAIHMDVESTLAAEPAMMTTRPPPSANDSRPLPTIYQSLSIIL